MCSGHKTTNDKHRENYDRIFKNEKGKEDETDQKKSDEQ